MSIISSIFNNLEGKCSLDVSVDGKEVVSVSMENKNITVNVKDVKTAIQVGMDSLVKKDKKSSTLKKLKEKGFKIKLKYKLFEVDV